MTGKGYVYGGECSKTKFETDVGKYCWSLCETRSSERIYAIGPTFSEYMTWLLVRRSGGLWRVVATAPDNGTAPAPW